MIDLTFRQQALLITIPLLTLVASNYANAEVYKWRDNRGVTQYSDRPPVDSFSKLTPNELVNSLQIKDLCADGPIKKNTASNVASTKDYSGFFTSFIKTKNTTATLTKNTVTGINSIKNNVTILGLAKPPTPPTPVLTAPPVIKPSVPVVTAPPVTKPAVPVVTAPPVTKPAEPVATKPPVTKPAEPVVTPPPSTTNPSTLPNIVQTGLMPAVNISKNIAPVIGFSDLRIRPIMGNFDIPSVGDGDGQFRIDCAVSHMSNDDPILYPNQQGAAHHHTFFGNTSVNYKSNLMTLSTTSNSTCRGGIANRSAYWVPSIIDTATNTPLVPYSALWYYKTGYIVNKSKITAPPKGLRIIAGNMKSTTSASSPQISFNCFKEGAPSSPATKHIPVCGQGWTIVTHINFPQCWDGKNLDSPDHQSHMTYSNNDYGGCPATHPVAIPSITLNVKYLIASSTGTKTWRMSSDNYPVNGNNAGYSSHADWVNGWDEKVIAGVVKNCLNAGKDCGNHMLGDGTVIYGDNVGVR